MMKYKLLIVLAAMALIFACCSEDIIVPETKLREKINRNIVTITANIGVPQTRVAYTENTEAQKMEVRWKEGDKIYLGYISINNSYVDIGETTIYNISPDGRTADFDIDITGTVIGDEIVGSMLPLSVSDKTVGISVDEFFVPLNSLREVPRYFREQVSDIEDGKSVTFLNPGITMFIEVTNNNTEAINTYFRLVEQETPFFSKFTRIESVDNVDSKKWRDMNDLSVSILAGQTVTLAANVFPADGVVPSNIKIASGETNPIATLTGINRSGNEQLVAGNAYRMPGLFLMGNNIHWKQNIITFTTNKAVGETISLIINAAEADSPGVWIDLNNNGTKDEGEGDIYMSMRENFTLGAQTLTLYGKVKQLSCDNNQLSSMDVSNNTLLEALYCENNLLNRLDFSKNTQLTSLYCYNNQLSTLDLSKNTQLKNLYCHYNQIGTLDLSNNTQLTYLSCFNNNLSTLDVSNNMFLRELYCYDNELTSLDVSNTQLYDLQCYNNNLSTLNVTNNVMLRELHCYNNSLSSLDLSKNTQLIYLDCNSNQLRTLETSKNTRLVYLDCSYNLISSLNIFNNTELRFLACNNNNISYLMSNLVNSLPNRVGKTPIGEFIVMRPDYTENNICTKQQVEVAINKNWKVLDDSGMEYSGR